MVGPEEALEVRGLLAHPSIVGGAAATVGADRLDEVGIGHGGPAQPGRLDADRPQDPDESRAEKYPSQAQAGNGDHRPGDG